MLESPRPISGCGRTCRTGTEDEWAGQPRGQLCGQLAKQIGATAKPRSITLVPVLPTTRSGNITRHRLKDGRGIITQLVDLAEDCVIGDISTLAHSIVMDRTQVRETQPPQRLPDRRSVDQEGSSLVRWAARQLRSEDQPRDLLVNRHHDLAT